MKSWMAVILAPCLVWACLFSAARAQPVRFALQPGDSQVQIPLGKKGCIRITEAELRMMDGLTIRGRLDWPLSFWDENVALCRKLNKPYTLLVMGGDVWDPTTAAHKAKVNAHIVALSVRFAADPLCWGVHVTGCSKKESDVKGHSEELFWGRPMPPKVLETNKWLISTWAFHFPTQKIILAGAANDPAAMRVLIKHGVTVAPFRFMYKINSLSPKTPTTGWVGTDLVVEASKAGAMIGFEMLQPSNHPNFSGTWDQMLNKKVALENRAGRKASYVAIYRKDFSKPFR